MRFVEWDRKEVAGRFSATTATLLEDGVLEVNEIGMRIVAT